MSTTATQKVKNADGSISEIKVSAVEKGKTVKGIGSKNVRQKAASKTESKVAPAAEPKAKS